MTLQYKHGSYTTSLGSSSVTETVTPIMSKRGRRIANKVRLDVSGRLRAADYGALQTAIDDLKAALENDNVDSGLYDDSLGAGTHFITNSDTIYGTRVISKSFPDSRGAENTTFRTYAFSVEAEIESLDPSFDGLASFEESITMLGDGSADIVMVETTDTLPEEQQLKDFTAVRAIQEGKAVGYLAYPSYPNLVFASGYRGKQSREEKGSPEIIGSSARNYPISWAYYFEFNSLPVFADPNLGV